MFYANEALQAMIFEELKSHCTSGGYGGFLPAVKQIANVAALPGIVKRSIGHNIFSLKDFHAIGLRSLSNRPSRCALWLRVRHRQRRSLRHVRSRRRRIPWWCRVRYQLWRRTYCHFVCIALIASVYPRDC